MLGWPWCWAVGITMRGWNWGCGVVARSGGQGLTPKDPRASTFSLHPALPSRDQGERSGSPAKVGYCMKQLAPSHPHPEQKQRTFSEKGPVAHASLHRGAGGGHTAQMLLCIFSVEGEGTALWVQSWGLRICSCGRQLVGNVDPCRGSPVTFWLASLQGESEAVSRTLTSKSRMFCVVTALPGPTTGTVPLDSEGPSQPGSRQGAWGFLRWRRRCEGLVPCTFGTVCATQVTRLLSKGPPSPISFFKSLLF